MQVCGWLARLVCIQVDTRCIKVLKSEMEHVAAAGSSLRSVHFEVFGRVQGEKVVCNW